MNEDDAFAFRTLMQGVNRRLDSLECNEFSSHPHLEEIVSIVRMMHTAMGLLAKEPEL